MNTPSELSISSQSSMVSSKYDMTPDHPSEVILSNERINKEFTKPMNEEKARSNSVNKNMFGEDHEFLGDKVCKIIPSMDIGVKFILCILCVNLHVAKF